MQFGQETAVGKSFGRYRIICVLTMRLKRRDPQGDLHCQNEEHKELLS